ncbi:hypothetical protein FJ423_21660 [Mesorhizobium sp. B2-8-9]|nr:hypothetical protein FJ423_21660 [Mesorhizobium sp. B2-8-9]
MSANSRTYHWYAAHRSRPCASLLVESSRFTLGVSLLSPAVLGRHCRPRWRSAIGRAGATGLRQHLICTCGRRTDTANAPVCTALSERRGQRCSRATDRGRLALYLDRRRYLKVRRGGHIVSVAVIIAVGVNSDGPARGAEHGVRHFGIETIWTAFLRKVMRRGLRGVKLVVSDVHEGIDHGTCSNSRPQSVSGARLCSPMLVKSEAAPT